MKKKLEITIACVGTISICTALAIFLHPYQTLVYEKSQEESREIEIPIEGLGGNIEEYEDAMYRIMELDNPSSSEEIDEQGLGFYTTISEVIGRRLPNGYNDDGGWQCSRYTGWLSTARWSYSVAHPDYGPVNGKDMTEWLVKNYDYKYIDEPVEGAIGSGGFSTKYGHTAMYLYSTGEHTAMVNDANFVPLTVSTHNMNIDGWNWVVPSNYEPEPTPEPEPESNKCQVRYVYKGDTLAKIMQECEGFVKWGEAMRDYAAHWHSTKFKLFDSVLDGWNSKNGVGLFADDIIEYRP